MLKLVIIGLLGASSAAGGVIIALSMASAPEEGKPLDEHPAAAIETVATELTAVPVISNGKVTAYLVLRVSSKIDRTKIKTGDAVVTPYISDAVFRATFDFAATGVTEIKAKHVEEISKDISRIANSRLGEGVVTDVNLEQFNLVSSSEIRNNLIRPE